MTAPDTVEWNFAPGSCHKYYPMYQFWVGGQLIHQRENEENPDWLLYPCEATLDNLYGTVTIH